MNKFTHFEVNVGLNIISVYINPKIFPISVIMQTAYNFIDKAMIIVDGDPQKYISVTLKFNDRLDKKLLELIGKEFNNELVSKYIEDNLSRRYAESRNAFINVALTPALIEQDNDKEECK